MLRAVAHAFPAALGIWAIGCVVPTPLEAEQTVPNQPPVITQAVPDFLTPLLSSVNTVDRLVVKASDGDVTDQLEAQLYEKSGDSYFVLGAVALTVPDPHNPTVRQGEFDISLCGLLGTGPGSKTLVVVVADVPFPLMPQDFFATSATGENKYAGHFDYKYWVLTCQ